MRSTFSQYHPAHSKPRLAYAAARLSRAFQEALRALAAKFSSLAPSSLHPRLHWPALLKLFQIPRRKVHHSDIFSCWIRISKPFFFPARPFFPKFYVKSVKITLNIFLISGNVENNKKNQCYACVKFFQINIFSVYIKFRALFAYIRKKNRKRSWAQTHASFPVKITVSESIKQFI